MGSFVYIILLVRFTCAWTHSVARLCWKCVVGRTDKWKEEIAVRMVCCQIWFWTLTPLCTWHQPTVLLIELCHVSYVWLVNHLYLGSFLDIALILVKSLHHKHPVFALSTGIYSLHDEYDMNIWPFLINTCTSNTCIAISYLDVTTCSFLTYRSFITYHLHWIKQDTSSIKRTCLCNVSCDLCHLRRPNVKT